MTGTDLCREVHHGVAACGRTARPTELQVARDSAHLRCETQPGASAQWQSLSPSGGCDSRLSLRERTAVNVLSQSERRQSDCHWASAHPLDLQSGMAGAPWPSLSGVSEVLEDSLSVETPRTDHARRAGDVNRPVTSLVSSCCGAGRTGTYCYRGIDIPRSPCPLFCGDVENFNAIGLPPFCWSRAKDGGGNLAGCCSGKNMSCSE